WPGLAKTVHRHPQGVPLGTVGDVDTSPRPARRRGRTALLGCAALLLAGCGSSGRAPSSRGSTSPTAPTTTEVSASSTTSPTASTTTVGAPGAAPSASLPATPVVLPPPTTWAYVENFGRVVAINLARGTTSTVNLDAAGHQSSDGYQPTPSPDRSHVAWGNTLGSGSVIVA